MPIELPTNSRFIETQPIIRDGLETFGRWKRPSFFAGLNDDDLVTIVVDNATAGRPDVIAADLYGTPFLEWVIVMLNRPKNTLGWPPTGSTIKAIDPSIVLANI